MPDHLCDASGFGIVNELKSVGFLKLYIRAYGLANHYVDNPIQLMRHVQSVSRIDWTEINQLTVPNLRTIMNEFTCGATW